MLANQASSTPPTTAASSDQVIQDGAGRLWTSLGQTPGLQMAWRRLPAFRDLQALSDSLSFATLPKGLLFSFLNLLRHVSLLVLLHPTPVRCLNRSFESPFNIWYQFDFRGNSSHTFISVHPVAVLIGISHNDYLIGMSIVQQFLQPSLHGCIRSDNCCAQSVLHRCFFNVTPKGLH